MNKVLVVAIFLFLLTSVVKAEYVLPYPSAMPGNKMYTLLKLFDTIKGYWSWGNFAQARYHLSQSDKLLVEAKTLFEYKQYLLAVDALKKSNNEFEKVPAYIVNAFSEGKDIKQQVNVYADAANKHIELLDQIMLNVPADFHWTPEKKEAVFLSLHQLLQQSIEIRKTSAQDSTAFYQCTITSTPDISTPLFKEKCEKEKQNFYPTVEPIMTIDEDILIPVDQPFNDVEGYL